MYSTGIRWVPHFKNSKRAGLQKVVTAKCGLVYGNKYTISIRDKDTALLKASTQLNVTVITKIPPCSQHGTIWLYANHATHAFREYI
jgi:hypothetical protein